MPYNNNCKVNRHSWQEPVGVFSVTQLGAAQQLSSFTERTLSANHMKSIVTNETRFLLSRILEFPGQNETYSFLPVTNHMSLLQPE